MTGAPKVIVLSGPLAMEKPENQYGTSVRYIRADAPELVAMVNALRSVHPSHNAHFMMSYIDHALAKWEAMTK